MKLKQCFLLLLLIVSFSFLTNGMKAKAINTGFSIEDLPKNDQNTFLSNVDISLLTEEPKKKGIACFDVNEDGLLAIAQNSFSEKNACVYSASGIFLYGYTFNCSQSFAIEWDNDFLNVYFVRSDVIVSLDPHGNVLEVKKVQNTTENNARSNDLLYSTSRTVCGTTYQIRNDMGLFNLIAPSFSKIIMVDATGAERVIYDAGSTLFSNIVTQLTLTLAFFSIVTAIVIWQFKMKKVKK